MTLVPLTETNYALYAAKHYLAAGSASLLEFQTDLLGIRNIHRLVMRYARTGVLKERLILNHLTILFNTFHPQAMIRMLAYKLFDFLSILKPFLLLLGFWPDRIEAIGPLNINIDTADIEVDEVVSQRVGVL
jgi:hypothetical protein